MYKKYKYGILIGSIIIMVGLFWSILGLTMASNTKSASRSVAVDKSLPITSVSIDCPYTVKLNNCSYITNFNKANVLTDNRFAKYTDYDNPDEFIAFYSRGAYSVSVVIDLKSIIPISNITMQTIKYDKYGIGLPTSVNAYTSTDNKNWVQFGDKNLKGDYPKITSQMSVLYYTMTNSYQECRYMRVDYFVPAGVKFYLSEVQVQTHTEMYYHKSDIVGNVVRDDQGVQYRLQNGEATVIGYRDKDVTVSAKGKLSGTDSDFLLDNATFDIGVGTGNQLQVKSTFIKYDNINNPRIHNNVQNIIIHNTGMPSSQCTARFMKSMMTGGGKFEQSWHFSTDDKGVVYQFLPTSMVGWHAGCAENYRSIGIEMCVNGAPVDKNGNFIFTGSVYNNWVNNVFDKTITNTAVLVAELLVKYDLGLENVLQHADVAMKNCPMWLRYSSAKGRDIREGDLWKVFMTRVEKYYNMYTSVGTKTVTTIKTSNIVIPNYIYTKSGKLFPVTKISSNAFNDKSDILSLNLGFNIHSIPDTAFYNTKINKILVHQYATLYYIYNNILYDNNKHIIYDPSNFKFDVESTLNKNGMSIEQIDGKSVIVDIAPGMTCRRLTAMLKNSVAIIHKGILSVGDEIIATGDKLYINKTEYTLCVMGDGNGDGKVNGADYIMLRRLILGLEKDLDLINIRAMSISTHSVNPTSADYVALRKYILENN